MVIQNSEGQVLLLKRHADHKLFPNEWCLPGGKRDMTDSSLQAFEDRNIYREYHDFIWQYKESPEESIYREVKEETGLKVYNFKNTDNTMMDDHYHMHVFEALWAYNEIEKEFPNREHVEYGFFDIDDLPEGISECTKEFLEGYYELEEY